MKNDDVVCEHCMRSYNESSSMWTLCSKLSVHKHDYKYGLDGTYCDDCINKGIDALRNSDIMYFGDDEEAKRSDALEKLEDWLQKEVTQ